MIQVYYFYGDQRCATCLKLEELSRRAVEGGFPEELESGVLRVTSINVDEEENRHFIEDYQRYTRALVVVERVDDRGVRHTNLTRIWELVERPKEFAQYVQSEIAGYLKEEHE